MTEMGNKKIKRTKKGRKKERNNTEGEKEKKNKEKEIERKGNTYRKEEMAKERARESKKRVDIQIVFKRDLFLPSLYISTSIHRAYPPSISLPLFLENREGSFGLPSLYISTFIQRKQDR